jgi:hypothetical protein
MNDDKRPTAEVVLGAQGCGFSIEHGGKELVDLMLSKTDTIGKITLPQVVYDPDGDCIEFLIADEDFYARRMNAMLTIYIGRESGDLVGSLIKGVNAIIKGILEQYPGFKVEITAPKFRLEHLFTAKLWEGQNSDDDDTMHVYLKQLRDEADRTDAEVELCEA